jgi:hypothetical protein
MNVKEFVYLIIYIPVTSCKEKALFLLKFSGLTRITSSSDVSSHEECLQLIHFIFIL